MSDSTHSGDLLIAPVPRITIQAFCETPDVAASIQAAADDRRMHKAHVKVQMGGAPAAVEAYRQAPTPNVIVLELIGDRASAARHPRFALGGLRRRHQGRGHRTRQRRRPLPRARAPRHQRVPHRAGRRCSTSSRRSRTCSAHRAPSRSGAPSRSSAPRAASARRPSRTISPGRWRASSRSDRVVADLDIAFGTAGLDFNQDPPQGIAEAIFAPERLDANLVDRLLSKCERQSQPSRRAGDARPHLPTSSRPRSTACSIFCAPRCRCIILDVPHLWTAWVRRTLIGADEIAIVAAPDLASLRNTKNLFDSLRQARPNDRKPKIVLNQVGLPKRPEISRGRFRQGARDRDLPSMPFDAAALRDGGEQRPDDRRGAAGREDHRSVRASSRRR